MFMLGTLTQDIEIDGLLLANKAVRYFPARRRNLMSFRFDHDGQRDICKLKIMFRLRCGARCPVSQKLDWGANGGSYFLKSHKPPRRFTSFPLSVQ